MATLELYGFDSLADAFSRISDIPWDVTSEALDEMADVAAKEIRDQGERMNVRDPDSSVHILDKIVTKKPKKTESGGTAVITFSGSRTRGKTRTRNAEIAFVNEYGKRGQAARPFIRTAMTQNEEKIDDAGQDVIGKWIETEFSRN